MGDLFRLIWCFVGGLFRPRASLHAEILVLRRQLNVLQRKSAQRLVFSWRVHGEFVNPRRNPRVGCPRIAQEIAHAFGIDIDKDIVRRVLANTIGPRQEPMAGPG